MKIPVKQRKILGKILAVAAFICLLLEYGITALTGAFTRYTLPLHLCSIAYLLCLIHAFMPEDGAQRLRLFLDQILYFPCMPGVFLAILFPDWSNYPAFNYITLTGFLGHGLLFVYITSKLSSGALNIKLKYTWMNIAFIAIYASLIAIFNDIFGTNYFFMAGPSVNSPLLTAYTGWGYVGYIVLYAALGLFGLYLAYIIKLLADKTKPGSGA